MTHLFLHARIRATDLETKIRYEAEIYATPFFFAWDEVERKMTLIDFANTRVFEDVLFFQLENAEGVVLKKYTNVEIVAWTQDFSSFPLCYW